MKLQSALIKVQIARARKGLISYQLRTLLDIWATDHDRSGHQMTSTVRMYIFYRCKYNVKWALNS